MSSAKLTLIGFNRWMKQYDEDLFKAFDDLPEGIDKDVLVNNILLRGGEFEVIYSDPYFMQEAIYTWLAKWQRTLEKWLAALAVKYDPLNNYDRTEEYTDEEDISDNRSDSRSRTNTLSLNEENQHDEESSHEEERHEGNANSSVSTSVAATNTTGTDESSGTEENTVSAFDASTYQPHDKKETSTSSETASSTGTTSTNAANGMNEIDSTGEESGTLNGSDIRSMGQAGAESEQSIGAFGRDRTLTHKAHLFGNIGITTSQEMLSAELSISEWNLYDHITDLFLTEFIIPVYI